MIVNILISGCWRQVLCRRDDGNKERCFRLTLQKSRVRSTEEHWPVHKPNRGGILPFDKSLAKCLNVLSPRILLGGHLGADNGPSRDRRSSNTHHLLDCESDRGKNVLCGQPH